MGPSQPGILPAYSDVMLLEGDRAVPVAAIPRWSAAVLPTDAATATEAQPLPLEPQLQWQSLAVVDWTRWVATASVAVVPDRDDSPRAPEVDRAGQARGSASPDDDAREITAASDSDLGRNSVAQTEAHPPQPSSEATTESPPPALAQAQISCPAYDSYLVPELSAVVEPGDGDRFAIQVKNVVIGYVNSQAVADQIAEELRQAVPAIAANPAALIPQIDDERGAGYLGGQRLFTLSHDNLVTKAPASLVAIQWVHHLRLAFGATPLSPSEAQMVAYGLGKTNEVLKGTASWYGPYFHGRQTATGEIFDQEEMTAAHKTLPFDTYLEVKNLLNGKTIVVRINDRGPYVGDRTLDLSYAAARCLDSDEVGLIPYEARILTPNGSHPWQVARL